jgi:TolB-like protein
MTRALLAAALAVIPALSAAAPRAKIAVTDIRSVQGVAPGTATILSDIVVSEIARSGFDVVSQADITAMIGFEKQKKVLGCSEDSSCLAEIGGALGVDFMLTGQVGQIGSRYRVSLLIVDTKKARVVARSAQFSDQNEDALVRAAESALQEVLAALRAPAVSQAPQVAPPPPAKVPAATTVTPPPPQQKPNLAARPYTSPPVAPVRSAGVRPSRTAAWVTLGAGVALIGGGAVLGLKAKSTRDDLAKAWAEPNYQSVYDSKSKDAKAYARNANVLYLLGGAATGASGWLFWRSRSPSFTVAPAVEDGRLALVAGGSF